MGSEDMRKLYDWMALLSSVDLFFREACTSQVHFIPILSCHFITPLKQFTQSASEQVSGKQFQLFRIASTQLLIESVKMDSHDVWKGIILYIMQAISFTIHSIMQWFCTPYAHQWLTHCTYYMLHVHMYIHSHPTPTHSHLPQIIPTRARRNCGMVETAEMLWNVVQFTIKPYTHY